MVIYKISVSMSYFWEYVVPCQFFFDLMLLSHHVQSYYAYF
jgi:hypothetical protein